MRLSLRASLLAAVFAFSLAPGAQAAFAPAAGSPFSTGGTGVQSVAIGNLNADAAPDMALVNGTENTVAVLLGNGAGGFALAGTPVGTGGTFATALAIGNLDGDGDQDVVVTNSSTDNVSVLLNNGSGTLSAAAGSPVTVGDSPASVGIANLNAGAVPDLAVANLGTDNVSIMLGNGSGGFSAAGGSPVATGGDSPSALAIGPIDAAGGLDIAVTNAGSTPGLDTVSILLGNGSGGFAAAAGSPVGTGGEAPQGVAQGDLNGDGKADLAIANASAGGKVTILLGNGAGAFAQAPGSPFSGSGPQPQRVAIGHLNGDGILDVAVADFADNEIALLLGNGAGGFSAAPESPLSSSLPQGLAVGDLDGNATHDIAVANFFGTASVFLNPPAAVTSQVPAPQPQTAPKKRKKCKKAKKGAGAAAKKCRKKGKKAR